MTKASGDARSDEEVDEEKRVLVGLNKEYEERFPGLRYVVFVDGRSRKVVFEDMRRRIERGNVGAERREAIKVSFP